MLTLIELKQTGPEQFLARFDNGEEIRTTLNVVADLDLYSGKPFTPEAYETMKAASGLSKCRQRALRIIGARPMSSKELFDRLKEKGETPENAEQTVRWLIDLRLLNDAEYAAMCVRHYAAKGYGSGKIRNEFYRRGIPKDLWDDALLAMPEQDDQIDRLLRKKLRSPCPDRDELRKAADFLYRRGFHRDEIQSAIQRYCDESEVDSYGL